MLAKIYYESNKEHHKKVSRDCYHDNKEHVLEYHKNRYSNSSKKEKGEKAIYAKNLYNNLPEDKKKNIKRAYAKNRYHSMHDDKKLELKAYQIAYQRKYQEMKKTQGNLAKSAVLTP